MVASDEGSVAMTCMPSDEREKEKAQKNNSVRPT
jgi:hypothetical protein